MTRIRTKVDNNFLVKVLSLFSAIALWFFVMNEQNPMGESSFTVPITVVDMPEGMKATLDEEIVSLKLRAPRSLFATADKTEMKVLASLANQEEGTFMVKLHAIVPQGFELVGIEPATVSIKLEPLVERQFEVNLIRAGSVSPEMTVSAVKPKQRIVTVTGAKSQIDRIARVIGYVGLNQERKEDFQLNVPLTAVSAEGKGIEDVKLSPGSVEVNVELVRGLAKKTIDIKPMLDGTLQSGYTMGKVTVNPSKLEVAGPAIVMNNVQVLYTEKISLDELTKTEKRKVKLILPDGVTAASDQVTVNVEINAK